MNNYDLGKEALEKQDLLAAYNYFVAAAEEHPNVPSIQLFLCHCAIQMAIKTDPLRERAFHHACKAAQMAPEAVETWIALGEVAMNCHKFEEAMVAFEKANTMKPDAKTWGLKGFCLARLGKHTEALQCYDQSLKIDPECGESHFLLSCVVSAGEHFNPALLAYHSEKAVFCEKPTLTNEGNALWNASHGYLHMGDYDKGWKYFDNRLKRNTMNAGQILAPERFEKPIWEGQKNCTVLIQHEMGLGDAITFMRYLPIIQEQFNIKIIYECMPQLMTLFRRNYPEIQCIELDQKIDTEFQYQFFSMSLPRIAKTTSRTIPFNGAYIHADKQDIENILQLFPKDESKLRVGLCYSGGARAHNSPAYLTDKKRSLNDEQGLDIAGRLNELGCHVISLMPDSKVFPNPHLKSFADTAALIETLDLVITVDTSVANLAGAMNKKTFLMNRFDTCWRWSRNLKSKWYPSIKEFRQKKLYDWQEVIENIIMEIKTERAKIAA